MAKPNAQLRQPASDVHNAVSYSKRQIDCVLEMAHAMDHEMKKVKQLVPQAVDHEMKKVKQLVPQAAQMQLHDALDKHTRARKEMEAAGRKVTGMTKEMGVTAGAVRA